MSLNDNVSLLNIIDSVNTNLDEYTYYKPNVVLYGNSNKIQINNGIVSGFDTGNGVIINSNTRFSDAAHTANNWEEVYKVKFDSLDTTQVVIGSNSGTYHHDVKLQNHLFMITLSSGADNSYDISNSGSAVVSEPNCHGTYTPEVDTWYWIKLVFTGTKYELSYSTDGINFTSDIIVNSSVKIKNNSGPSFLGVRGNLAWPLQGELDLNECYIKINGNLWWKGITEVKYSPNIAFDEVYKRVHLIYNYSSGTSYIRIYSDGWCEQGGQFNGSSNEISITFSRKFLDVPNVTFGGLHSNTDNSSRTVNMNSLTNTGFTAYTKYAGATSTGRDTGGTFYWKATGFTYYQ